MGEFRAQISRLELEYGVLLKALGGLENRLKKNRLSSGSKSGLRRANRSHSLVVSSASTKRSSRSNSNAVRVRFRRIQNQIGSLEEQKKTLNGIIGNLKGQISSLVQVIVRNDSTLEEVEKKEAFFLRILGRMSKNDPKRLPVQKDLAKVRGIMKLIRSQTESVRTELRELIEQKNAAEETFKDIKQDIKNLEAEADQLDRSL